MLSQIEEALDNLKNSICQGNQYKIKAKKSKFFENLTNNPKYQSLIS
ncbi:MAG: TPR end-of-group domain-containing protein [Nitrosopumilaceae archaeon]